MKTEQDIKKTAGRTGKICKRCSLVVLEVCAALIALFLAGTLYLSWQLSKGPMDIGFLIPHLEKAFTYPDKGIKLAMGGAHLEWPSLETPPQIQVQDVEIRKIDGTPVAIVSRLGITISAKALLQARIVPSAVTVFEPALKVYRTEDGGFAFDIGTDAKIPAAQEEESADLPRDTEFITQLLRGLGGTGDPHTLGGDLKQISIVNAWLAFEDRLHDVTWVSPRTDILVSRDEAGITAQARLDLEMTPETIASLQARIFYNRESRASRVVATFRNVDPKILSEKDPRFIPLKALSFILNGSLNVTLDSNFMPIEAIASLNGENGHLDIPELYEQPVPVKSTAMELLFNMDRETLTLRNLAFDLGGPKAVLRGTVHKTPDMKLETNIEGELTAMPMDNLHRYWPPALAKPAQKWVTTRLSAGTAQKATIKARGLSDLKTPFSLALEDLDGTIDFTGISVDYLPPMQEVTDVSGTATYSRDNFTLDITGGKLLDMNIIKSDIVISNFQHNPGDHTRIDIRVSLNGPLNTAMKVINSDPLNYADKFNIDPERTQGQSKVDVTFKFPLHSHLSMPEVNVTANAALSDVFFPQLVAGLDVAGGPMDLSVTNKEMRVSGNALLAGTSAQFSWINSFDTNTKIQSEVKASLNLNTPLRKHFGVDFEDWIIGDRLPLSVVHTLYKDRTETLHARADATPAILALPEFSYTKPQGQQAVIEALVHMKNRTPVRVDDLKILSSDLQIEGTVSLTPEKEVSYLNFPVFKFGKTDAILEGEAKKDGSFEYLFRGVTLDISTLLKKSPKPEDFAARPEPPKPVVPVSVSFELSNLITGENRNLHDVKAFLRRNMWGRIEQLEIDGKAGGSDVYVRYLPTADGKHTLRFEAGNAGAALRALNISNSIEGGVLVIDGQPRVDGGPRDLGGKLSLTNFRVVNLPLLARLLNALSLSGFQQLLSGNGIAFRKLGTTFFWQDTVWAAGQRGEQRLVLKDGRTSGASLGLTLEGNVNYVTNRYDLNGTIVPISGVNKLIGDIPLVGDILTGGTDAVFAATYTIKGPRNEPTVTVNPLAALAPGVLRKILFED